MQIQILKNKKLIRIIIQLVKIEIQFTMNAHKIKMSQVQKCQFNWILLDKI